MQKLTLLKTAIRRDSAGRFCLNDLHRAAGAESAHQPSNWLRLDTVHALIAEISNSSDVMSKPIAVAAGRHGETYVARELVYAYAMWVSPKFHLTVIRAFDARSRIRHPTLRPFSRTSTPLWPSSGTPTRNSSNAGSA